MKLNASPKIGRITVTDRYEVECYDRNGKLKWIDGFENLVVHVGLEELLDRLVKTVPANVLWYVGLKGTGAPANADTMASHAGWATLSPYSNATDPAFTPGTISSAAGTATVDNDASKAVFNINATSTIYGAFSKDNSTKGGTTGTLYGAGDFAASRGVEDGDTLNVKITKTISNS